MCARSSGNLLSALDLGSLKQEKNHRWRALRRITGESY